MRGRSEPLASPSVEPVVAPGSGAMFDRIAKRYDLLNRLMSLGVDQSWRRSTIAALELRPRARVLDVATGTGDMALLALRRHPAVEVDAVDPSPRMLAIGAEKAARRRVARRLRFVEGCAESLPFPRGAFDAAMIAFGIRNVVDRPAALREMARVTRADGRVAILELTEPRRGVASILARFYVHHLVPTAGALLSGAPEYRYLQRSIEAFPSPQDFARMIRNAGLDLVETRRMTLGVCHLFLARPAR